MLFFSTEGNCYLYTIIFIATKQSVLKDELQVVKIAHCIALSELVNMQDRVNIFN